MSEPVSVSKKMDMFEECSSMTNVTIVCSDGIIHTHKIVVATASDFIKHLLSDIPVGDEVTIFLPDNERDKVEEWISVIFSTKNQEDINDVMDVGCNLKCEPTLKISPDDIKEEVEAIYSGDFIKEETTKSNADQLFTIPKIKKDSKKVKISPQTLPLSEDKIQEVEELEDRIRSLEESRMKSTNAEDSDHQNSITENPPMNNRTILEKQILFEKAKVEVLKGKSVRAAASMFKISHVTLSRFLKTNMEYQGRGRRSKVLTAEEETSLTQRLLDVSEGGSTLSYKLIGDLITQEFEIIQINEPERDLRISEKSGSKVTDKYIKYFAKRTGLDKFVTRNNELSLESRRQNGSECDVCGKMYTNEKNMRDHRKNIHFSFLK